MNMIAANVQSHYKESCYRSTCNTKQLCKSDSPSTNKDQNKAIPKNPVLEKISKDLLRLQQELGSNHVMVAETWNAMGLIRVHMQRDAEAALPCHQKALQIYQENGQRLEVAITLIDEAYCNEKLGQEAHALELYKNAQEILQKDLQVREDHPQLLVIRRAVSRLQRF